MKLWRREEESKAPDVKATSGAPGDSTRLPSRANLFQIIVEARLVQDSTAHWNERKQW
jgi:hypothetical protein